MLVLNLNYVPVNVCTVRRAVVMVDKGKAELLEQHEGRLHTIAGPVDAPAIIPAGLSGEAPVSPAQAVEAGSVYARPLHLPVLRGKRRRI